ncbi:hypothetical protein NPIL_268011 [Nephila pilipes]|uniref:Uncharacterized protein n=1 Tax=Nephila pilipes TaxID=299642 RepID=A0A8X6QQI8_NEPPI|nr:hypothetical protein NPIL_268011 [Nephila pilipes]
MMLLRNRLRVKSLGIVVCQRRQWKLPLGKGKRSHPWMKELLTRDNVNVCWMWPKEKLNQNGQLAVHFRKIRALSPLCSHQLFFMVRSPGDQVESVCWFLLSLVYMTNDV